LSKMIETSEKGMFSLTAISSMVHLSRCKVIEL
jgi:hypothetical protein